MDLRILRALQMEVRRLYQLHKYGGEVNPEKFDIIVKLTVGVLEEWKRERDNARKGLEHGKKSG